jgi:putative transposase
MATLSHYFTQFEEEGVYHVYNRVVDRKPLFTKKRNYDYFLSKLKRYVSPYANIYAFCLLHNHFHILLRVKALGKELSNVKELTNLDQGIPTPPHYSYSADYQYIMPGYKKNQTHIIVSNAFKKMFQSYALAFNRQEDRIGTLFQTPFKRSEIDSDEYLAKIIYHIHFHKNTALQKISGNILIALTSSINEANWGILLTKMFWNSLVERKNLLHFINKNMHWLRVDM